MTHYGLENTKPLTIQVPGMYWKYGKVNKCQVSKSMPGKLKMRDENEQHIFNVA